MADSETKKKIMAHRKDVMLREAGQDGFLKQILNGEQKPAIERIIDDLVNEEPGRFGLMHPDAIRREIKTRWTERQELQQGQPALEPSL